jgi:hypothetical protein
MSFDLSNYEDVNSRIKRFRLEFPTGRLIAYIEDIDITKGYILMKAEAYRTSEDLTPAAVDYAFEIRTDRGVNQLNWVENCTTSVYGRVIGLLTPGETNRATRQDMEQVAASENVIKPAKWFPNEGDLTANWGDETSPSCDHGRRMLREGISDKTGKAFHGWVCTFKDRELQCKPIWYEQDLNTGKWEAPK